MNAALDAPGSPSARALRLAALLGVRLRPARRGPVASATAVRSLRRLAPGTVVFITGPSGGGKSTLLRAVAGDLRARGRAVVTARGAPRSGRRCALDLVPGALDEALRVLAAAGLSEAPALLRPARALSDGQRARLGLARAMARTPRGGTLLCDELGAGLDGVTARAVARGLARWARAEGRRLIAASAHTRLVSSLDPDVVVFQPLDAPARVIARPREIESALEIASPREIARSQEVESARGVECARREESAPLSVIEQPGGVA